MEDIFKPKSLSVKQLFGDTDALYQIPRYQRPYSWGDEQLEKLWEDLLDAKDNNPNYFLGSIITAKPQEQSPYLDIVDGQQRLTTLTILLCVVRDLFPELNKQLSEEDPFAIDSRIISTSIKFNDKFERLRLRTHSHHQSDFESIILNGDTSNYTKPKKKDLSKEEEPIHKFRNTAYFFADKLSDLGVEETGFLINYLFNQVKIIRIDCQEVSFAIKLFQVLNDRGLDLSNSDLIKSYLIGRIQSSKELTQDDKSRKEDQFLDDWKESELIASHTETSMNDLFVMYEYYLLEQNPKKSLYDEMVGKLQFTDPNNSIADFKTFCQKYKKELFDKNDKMIYSFWYLKWSMYWKTILLSALHNNYPEYAKLTKALRRFYYLNWIAGYTLTKIKQISFNLVKWVKEGKSFSAIHDELESHIKQYNTINRAKDNLAEDIYNEPWCKPLLFLIEYQQTDESNLNFLDYDINIHVEHILPVAYEKNDGWKMFHDNKDIENWVNCGANLTLLSGEKNISASNESFEMKVKTYNGIGIKHDKKGTVTSFRITQKIADDYQNNLYGKEWNQDALNARWNWFCDEVSEILDIELDDIKV